MFPVIITQSNRPKGTIKQFRLPSIPSEIDGSGDNAWGGMVKSPNAGKFIILEQKTATPYVAAKEYDPATKVTTTLTVSGAMTDGNDTQDREGIVYVSSNSTIYVHRYGAGTPVSKLIPYTLSGTTLTKGTEIDISADIPVADARNNVITTDGTYIYFFNVQTGVLKRCSNVGTGFVTLTGTTTFGSGSTNRSNGQIWKSGSYLYVFRQSTYADRDFRRYNIAGDSWASRSITFPVGYDLSVINDYSNSWAVIADEADDTYFYLHSKSTNSDVSLYRYTSATDTWAYVQAITWVNGRMMAYATGNNNDIKVSPMVIASNYAFCHVGYTSNLTGVYLDISEWIMSGLVSYTGSGSFEGIYRASGDTANPNKNDPPRIGYIVDGGTEQYLDLTNIGRDIFDQKLNIRFTTSLKIKSYDITIAINPIGTQILYYTLT